MVSMLIHITSEANTEIISKFNSLDDTYNCGHRESLYTRLPDRPDQWPPNRGPDRAFVFTDPNLTMPNRKLWGAADLTISKGCYLCGNALNLKDIVLLFGDFKEK